MQWKGETADQRMMRIERWHKHFLWFPRQMKDGHWIWLETVWRKWEPHVWRYSDALIKPEEIFRNW